MTDTERESLCARIDELCAENERLRNQLRDQQDTAEHNFVRNAREYKRVCDENAKLRELVDYMTPIAWYAASERERDRMRELVVGE